MASYGLESKIHFQSFLDSFFTLIFHTFTLIFHYNIVFILLVSQILGLMKWNPVWTVYSSQKAAHALYFLLKTVENTMKYNVLPVGFVCCGRCYQGGWFEWDQMNPQTSCCCWFRAGVLGWRDLQWGSFQHMKLCWLVHSTALGRSLALTSARFSLEGSNVLSCIGNFCLIH